MNCGFPYHQQISPSGVSDNETAPLILVVEDDPCLLDLLFWLLTDEGGFRVLGASTGEGALNLLEETRLRPHLFLFDYELPKMNGLQLYDHLHACPGYGAIPCLMVSADPPFLAMRERHMVGLQKPYDIDRLLESVGMTIEKREQLSGESKSFESSVKGVRFEEETPLQKIGIRKSGKIVQDVGKIL